MSPESDPFSPPPPWSELSFHLGYYNSCQTGLPASYTLTIFSLTATTLLFCSRPFNGLSLHWVIPKVLPITHNVMWSLGTFLSSFPAFWFLPLEPYCPPCSSSDMAHLTPGLCTWLSLCLEQHPTTEHMAYSLTSFRALIKCHHISEACSDQHT